MEPVFPAEQLLAGATAAPCLGCSKLHAVHGSPHHSQRVNGAHGATSPGPGAWLAPDGTCDDLKYMTLTWRHCLSHHLYFLTFSSLVR